MPPKAGGSKAGGGGGGGAKGGTNAAAADHADHGEEIVAKVGPAMPWSGEVQPTNAVAGRTHHISVLWDGKLVCFGGWDGRRLEHHRELTVFDFATSTWSSMETVGEMHPGTSQAAAAEVGGALLVFGGWDGQRRVNTMTMLHLEDARWVPFPAVGEPPAPVTFHTCTVVSRRLYVYGGNTADGQQGDMRILDLNSTEWSVAMAHGAPPRRSSHTATPINDSHLVIFGGRGGADGTQVLNDVAVFDTTANQWVIGVKVEGAPSPRYGHSAIAVGSRVVVFGGVNDKGVLLDDLWVLDCTKPNQLSWAKIPASSSSGGGGGPSARAGHSAVEALGSMYIVGGRTDHVAHTNSEIHHLDLTPVAPLTTTSVDDGTGMMGTGGHGGSGGLSHANLASLRSDEGAMPSDGDDYDDE